jgi:geranylgeranyl diphosphate synthase type II
MRPVLTLAACEMFGGNYKDAAYSALAIEVFHNFTLLHDDIMDKAPLRRNKATVHNKWNENIAILSGDAMFVKSQQLMLKTPDYALRSVLEVFHQTALEVCEGQQLDMNFESMNNVSLHNYIHMIELKTAVLLGAALKIGALIAKADEGNSKQVYQFGKNIGIAFQLKDDILDVYGDPEKFGKQVGGDILSNKKTYLLLKAIELAKLNKYKEEELTLWLRASEFDPKHKVEAVTEIYNFLGVKKLAEQEMEHYYSLALKNLNSITVPEQNKIALVEFADYLMKREV